MATARVVQDLNADARLPFADASFDAVLHCVPVEDLVRATWRHDPLWAVWARRS